MYERNRMDTISQLKRKKKQRNFKNSTNGLTNEGALLLDELTEQVVPQHRLATVRQFANS